MKHPCWWKLMVTRKSLHYNLKCVIIKWLLNNNRGFYQAYSWLLQVSINDLLQKLSYDSTIFAVGVWRPSKFSTLAGKDSQFCERYIHTDPAASDNINRMQLVVNDEKKKLLLYGLRYMKRYSVFVRQVYMDFVRCWCDSQVLQGGIIKVFAKIWEHGADEIDA